MSVYLVRESEAKTLAPRMVAGFIFVGGVILALVAQIALGMVLTEDAYKLRELRIEQSVLAREVQIISEEVDSLASPQNLADSAHRLGMIVNSSPVLIDIETDVVYGKPVPADPSRARIASASLVANSALGVVSDFSASTVASLEIEGQGSVEAEPAAGKGISLSVGEIPASPTR